MRVRTAGRRFAASQAGATALEFAIVAVPFLLILFAVLEAGMFFVVDLSVTNATAKMARKIRVGSIVAPGNAGATGSGGQMSLADFKAQICTSLTFVPAATCASQLQVDIRPISGYGATPPASPFSGRSFDGSSFCYYSGGVGSVVEMRVYYLWKLLTPLLLDPMANVTTMTTASGSSSGDWMAATAVEIFTNEPNATMTNPGSGR